MKEYSEADMQVIRQRQMNCKHSFIKHMSDVVHHCPKCGVTQAEWEAIQASWGAP